MDAPDVLYLQLYERPVNQSSFGKVYEVATYDDGSGEDIPYHRAKTCDEQIRELREALEAIVAYDDKALTNDRMADFAVTTARAVLDKYGGES